MNDKQMWEACLKEIDSWEKETLSRFMRDQGCDTVADVAGVLYYGRIKRRVSHD